MPHAPARAYYLALHAELRHNAHRCTHGPLREPVGVRFSFLDDIPITWVTHWPECLLSFMDRFGAKFLGPVLRSEWQAESPVDARDLVIDGEPHDT